MRETGIGDLDGERRGEKRLNDGEFRGFPPVNEGRRKIGDRERLYEGDLRRRGERDLERERDLLRLP